MTTPDFATMTRQELRAYVLKHQEDIEAFHALMDKLNAEPGNTIRSPEHLAALIEAKRKASQQ
jgi:hypothetical protein